MHSQTNPTSPHTSAPIHTGWTGLFDGNGEPSAAFVRGHLDVAHLCLNAEDHICAAFGEAAPAVAAILDTNGGAALTHFWLREIASHEGTPIYSIAVSSQSGAFPVTGVRLA